MSGKNWSRGIGRSVAMHDKLIDGVERKLFRFRDDEPMLYDPNKRAWTPERWNVKAVPTIAVESKPLDVSGLKKKWGSK